MIDIKQDFGRKAWIETRKDAFACIAGGATAMIVVLLVLYFR